MGSPGGRFLITPGGTCDHPVVGTLRIYTPANPPLGAGATILSSGSTSTPSPFFIYTVSPTLNAGGIFPYVHVKDVTPYSTSFSEGAVP